MKKALALLLAVVMIFGLAACGKEPTPTQPAGTENNQTKPGESKDNPASTEAPKEYKKEIILGQDVKLETLDPQEKADIAHQVLWLLTHETLVRYDENTKAFICELAESYEVSADCKTYTFHLRRGVKFHDGSSFTADDVLFTIERGLTLGTVVSQVKQLYELLDTYEKKDDYTVQFVLKKTNADFLITSGNSMSILSKAACQADPEKGGKIGTGPFYTEEYNAGDYVLLKRFNDYWGEAPVTEAIRIRYIPEASARLIALENKEIDICTKVEVAEKPNIKANKDLDYFEYFGSLSYLFYNFDNAPFDDVNFRQAVTWALDIDEINMGVYDGAALKAKARVAPYEFGYFDDWTSVGREPYSQNEQKAKDYLAKSKYAGQNISFRIAVNNNERALVAQLIQGQLKKVLGVTVEIKQYDSAGFSAIQKERDWDTLIASIGYTPAGDGIRLSYGTGAGQNKMHYSNPKVDELFDKALEEQNSAKRLEYYKEIQCILYDDCPTAPLFFAGNAIAYNAKLEGVKWFERGFYKLAYAKLET